MTPLTDDEIAIANAQLDGRLSSHFITSRAAVQAWQQMNEIVQASKTPERGDCTVLGWIRNQGPICKGPAIATVHTELWPLPRRCCAEHVAKMEDLRSAMTALEAERIEIFLDGEPATIRIEHDE